MWPTDRLTLAAYCPKCRTVQTFVARIHELANQDLELGVGQALPGQPPWFSACSHRLDLLAGTIYGLPRCQACRHRLLARWEVRDRVIVAAEIIGEAPRGTV